MQLSSTQGIPVSIRLARHIAAMGLVALANPLIYYSQSPAYAWSVPFAGAIAFAVVAVMAWTLIAPHRIKQIWMGVFTNVAWVALALMMFASWQDSRPPAYQTPTAQQAAPADEWLKEDPPTERWRSGTLIEE